MGTQNKSDVDLEWLPKEIIDGLSELLYLFFITFSLFNLFDVGKVTVIIVKAFY